MASRTRIISQSKAVYVSPTGTLGNLTAPQKTTTGVMPQQLHRVDTFSFDIDIAGGRQDIREFGQLARIGTITLGDLNPSFSLGYYLGEGENEGNLGFNGLGISALDGSLQDQFISGILSEDPAKREKNLFVLTVKEGADAFASTSSFIDNPTGHFTTAERAGHDVVSLGNCNFESYSLNFAVGEIPRVDIDGTAENLTFDTTSSGLYNPSLNKAGGRADTGQFMLGTPSTGSMDVLVLRPEDVTLSFSKEEFAFGGTDLGDMHVQSASIEVPLSRTPIEALGSAKAVAKPLDFPINVTMSVSALLKNFQEGQIDKILTGSAGAETTNITLNVKGEDGKTKHQYVMQKAVMDSQGFSQGLDDNETIDLVFSTQIGGTNQTDQGFFYSGLNANQPDVYSSTSTQKFGDGFMYTKNNVLGPYSSEDGAGS
jgi:hypothetical protein